MRPCTAVQVLNNGEIVFEVTVFGDDERLLAERAISRLIEMHHESTRADEPFINFFHALVCDVYESNLTPHEAELAIRLAPPQ